MYGLRSLATAALAVSVAVACTGGSSAAGASQQTACTIVGTSGPDRNTGTAGDDIICAGAGDDVIAAGDGNDVVLAGPGNDQVSGGPGRDRLVGGLGNDVLRGGKGADTLRGQWGNDRVGGGRGQDVVYGGEGADRLSVRDNVPYDRVDGGTGTNLCIADAGDTRELCGHPLVARNGIGVPVLMYHVIKAPTASTPLPHLYVAPEVFAAQMRWLHERHYHVVTLQEVYDHWHGAPLPSRPIVVSFDDGFTNQWSQAMPVLDRYGWAGTLNLALSHYEQRSWGLSHRMVQGMIYHGWELDSHTMTHASLPGLSDAELQYQVGKSRSVLRRAFHVPVNFFCYPGGLYDSRVIGAVRRAGYKAATSTIEGLARPGSLWTLDRVRVSNGDGVSGLAAHLRALGLPT
jgi:peptidoglycan/xylan/chitin deacetylase (PgdA/CDA1 family)